MILKVFDDKVALGNAAAAQAAAAIRRAIARRAQARVVAASAASQFDFLEALTATPDIDWKRVELFHLDEYIGLPIAHPASFCKFLQDRLIGKTGITNHHLLNPEEDPATVIERTSKAISASPIDVSFVGIGENGHLAFNDPPADFETEVPYIVVTLDEACRQQQVAEGWFQDLAAVPKQAISCRRARSSRPGKFSPWFLVPAKRKRSRPASTVLSAPWRLPRFCARILRPPFISTNNLRRCLVPRRCPH